MKKVRNWRLTLGWQILIGLILGVVLGAVFYHNQVAITAMQNIGTMFIHLIQMIVLPIVVSCLTVGIAGMGDIGELGRVGLKTLIYFEILTTIALVVGMIFANVFHPGTYIDIHSLQSTDISSYVETAKHAKERSGLWSTIMNIIPTNIFSSLSEGNMMPIILFSVLFGLGITAIGKQGQILIDGLTAIQEVMFKITNWIMHLSPIGVCALIGVTIAQMGIDALKPLGLFILIAYVAMVFFVIVVLGIVAKIHHVKFFQLLKVIKNELILAFSTASSEAALPKIIDKMQKYGVSQGIVSFVIPTGYTFNLDGSAIYQAVGALFLAQAYHINLSIGQQITLLVVLMITSKGMAGVPGASFVVLLATVSTIGVPMAGLTFIAGVDRIIDMGRTAVNVVGNSLAAIIMGKSEGEFDEEKHAEYVKNI
ncbi:cation:dicarboxylate symporter family transporter [Pediococcus pentosaceus]|uniref:cation:dicarboxylate symporter family transporter n=1 Tax=Pediococcus pentosaceus TaxID=1255 RepID=UPI0035936A18